MNWNTAIKKIEEALAEGQEVEIRYHRKWMKQQVYYDRVDEIISYEWEGETVNAVSTWNNVVDDYSYIIDEVRKEGE